MRTAFGEGIAMSMLTTASMSGGIPVAGMTITWLLRRTPPQGPTTSGQLSASSCRRAPAPARPCEKLKTTGDHKPAISAGEMSERPDATTSWQG